MSQGVRTLQNMHIMNYKQSGLICYSLVSNSLFQQVNNGKTFVEMFHSNLAAYRKNYLRIITQKGISYGVVILT